VTSEVPTSPSSTFVSPEPLMRMIQGLQVTAILRAGVQLKIFDQIACRGHVRLMILSLTSFR
jgi:hypothetical protein